MDVKAVVDAYVKGDVAGAEEALKALLTRQANEIRQEGAEIIKSNLFRESDDGDEDDEEEGESEGDEKEED